MYLRTTARTNLDGSKATYYQLAHNVWDPQTRRAKAVVVHNFGRAETLDVAVLERLCRSVARVCGLDVRASDGSQRDARSAGAGKSKQFGLFGALPDGVEIVRTRELGTVHVIAALWRELGIGAAVRKAVVAQRAPAELESALLAMVANRLCRPESKLGVWDRWLETVHLPECNNLKLHQMYEAMDVLHEHVAEVEEAVFFSVADLMNLTVDLVFYDTTTCSFALDEPDGDGGLRQFGHSKDGAWAPQVVVALAVTRDGIPVRSWVLPGNTADVTTVETVKRDLRGWKLGRALFVADSGMNSAGNRAELVKACGRYLLAVRAGSVGEVQHDVLSRAGRYKEVAENLWVKEVEVGEGELRRRYLVCHNPREAERQRAHRQEVLAEIEAELAKHRDHDAKSKWTADLRSSGRHGRYVKLDAAGRIAVDRAAVAAAERLDGKWVLQTNDDTLSAEDAAQGYKSMLVIEQCFRSLKRTQIRLTPMYHWLDRRIAAHVRICVLALTVQRVAELRSGRSWHAIRTALEAVQASELKAHGHRFFQANEPGDEALAVMKSLGLKPPSKLLGMVAEPAAA
jgi:transposase